MKDKVVITGVGMVCSLGQSASGAWDALLSGKNGIGRIIGFDASGFDCHAAAQVNGLNPAELGIHPRDARIMDRHSYMLMKSSRDAFINSNLNAAQIKSEDIGFFAGIGMVDYSIEDLLPSVLKSLDPNGGLNYDAFFSNGYQEIYPLWPLSMLNNISFCQVAIKLGIKGENTVFSPHADSGILSVVEAARTLIEKKAKVALAGGVSEKVSAMSLARASLFGILNNGAACSPFSAKRNGTVLGEGCGILALELKSSAEKRQIPYMAAIAGYGFSFGLSEGSTSPTSEAMAFAMHNAISSAGLKPSDIDLVIANGDGTYYGDKNEIEAIHKVFKDCIGDVNVFSSKGALGHMLAGASAVDIILGAYMLGNGIIPAMQTALPLEDNIKFNVVCKEPKRKALRRIMINAQSYEGQCASLIVEGADM